MEPYVDYGNMIKEIRKEQTLYPWKMTHERMIERLDEDVLTGQSKPTKGALSKIEHGNTLPGARLSAAIAIVFGDARVLTEHPKAEKHIDTWLEVIEEQLSMYGRWAAHILLEGILTLNERETNMSVQQTLELYRLKAYEQLINPVESYVSEVYTSEELPEVITTGNVPSTTIPYVKRLRSSLSWLAKMEKLAEYSGITPEKRVEIYLLKAEAYFWSNNDRMAAEYALRARTVAENLIPDESVRHEYMKQILWRNCMAYGQLPERERFDEYYKEYTALVPVEEAPDLHARILSVVGGYELAVCNYREAMGILHQGLLLFGQSIKKGSSDDWRSTGLWWMYLWATHFAGERERAWMLLNTVRDNDGKILIDGEICGYCATEVTRVELMLLILDGGTYTELQKRIEPFYATRLEDQVVCGSTDELVAIAFMNQGDTDLSLKHYRNALELLAPVFNIAAVEGLIRRAERRTGVSFLEERLTYAI